MSGYAATRRGRRAAQQSSPRRARSEARRLLVRSPPTPNESHREALASTRASYLRSHYGNVGSRPPLARCPQGGHREISNAAREPEALTAVRARGQRQDLL